MKIVRGSAADIAKLEPLWVAVHHAHRAAMPDLAPYVDDATTWDEHRPLYDEILAKPDSVLLLAHDDDGALVGYALAHTVPVGETWIADTWVTGDRIAELETIAVADTHRGQGIGTALLDEIDAEIATLGVHDMIIGALAGNAAALRLYERRGFRPTWLYLSRFAGRE